MRRPKLIDGMPIVKSERDAMAVYDADAQEIVADVFPIGPWSLGKSKALRERGTGHRCYFIGWPERYQVAA